MRTSWAVKARPGRLVQKGLLLAAAMGAVTSPPTLAAQQQRGRVLRAQTDMVTILASVTDAAGRPMPDLSKDAFQLAEEGAPQKIEYFEAQTNRPLDLALMIDSSLSTYKDLHFETDAAAHFIKQVMRPGDTMGVFAFSEAVERLADFSTNVSQLQAAVRRVAPGAGTSIYDAIVLASGELKRRLGTRRRAIVLVTDGGETTSISKFDETRRAAIASGALLYTILIRPVKNEGGRNTAGEHALITITDSVGGNMYILDDMGQIQETFDRIDRELRTQYLLGYYPDPPPPPGSDRHVSVQVAGTYAVRYRKEYFTPGTPR